MAAGTLTQAAILAMRNGILGTSSFIGNCKLHSGDPGATGLDNLIPMFRRLKEVTDPSLVVTDTPTDFFGYVTVYTRKTDPFGPIRLIHYASYTDHNSVTIKGPVTITHITFWSSAAGSPVKGFIATFPLVEPLIITEKIASIGTETIGPAFPDFWITF